MVPSAPAGHRRAQAGLDDDRPPQADFWFPVNGPASEWSGQFYSENTPLGVVACRGEFVESAPGGHPKLLGTIGDRTALGGDVKVNEWNQYLIMARGGTFTHVLNRQLMAVYVDDDPASTNNQNRFIGIEIEGAPSKVLVRNVWLKKLRYPASSSSSDRPR